MIARRSRSPLRAPSLAALPLILLALVACGRGDRSRAGAGGTIVIAQTAEPATLFPPRMSQVPEQVVVTMLFERLAELGPALNTIGDSGFVPALARRWQWANDSMSIAFALNPQARWHDGVPVRAEDVRYTFHVYTSPVVASEGRTLLQNIDSVTVRDSLTAVFWFARRTPQQFLDATATMYILPAHQLAAIPDSALVRAPFGRQPVGSGPFRFARWEAGSRLELVADSTRASGRPSLDRLVFSYVPDLPAATVKLLAGEADFLDQVRSEGIAAIRQAPNLRLHPATELNYAFVGFNLEARRSPIGKPGAPHPILGDVRVRRALTMATDRATIVRSVLDSLGTVALGPAPRALIPDTAALRPLPFDIAAASALLDSAGWTGRAADGTRLRGTQRLAFELLVPSSSPTRIRMSVLLQAACKTIGVDLSVLTQDPATLGPRIDARDFDAYLGGFQASPGLQGVRQVWTSTGSSNYQGYRSPRFDQLADSALTAFAPAVSRSLWTRAFQVAIDEAPSLWLFEQHTVVAAHRRLQLPPFRADGWFYTIPAWSVDPTQR